MRVNSATLPPPSSAFRSGSSAVRSSLGSCSSRVTPIVMCGRNVEASTGVPAMSSRSCGASTSTTTAEWKQFTRWYTASNAPLCRNSCGHPPAEVAPPSHTCKKCSGRGVSHSKLARAPWSSSAACLISLGGTTTQPSATNASSSGKSPKKHSSGSARPRKYCHASSKLVKSGSRRLEPFRSPD